MWTDVQVVDFANEQALEATIDAIVATLGGIGGLAYCTRVNVREDPDPVGGGSQSGSKIRIASDRMIVNLDG